MSRGFYQKLAIDGIRKNSRMYFPYILTCICMIMMEYIIFALSDVDMIGQMQGGEQTQTILLLGGWVIAVFSCVFLFYTNSFLIRRRKKEFGLYNILGMEKKHIGRILIWESIIVAAGSLMVGLSAGVLFSKLAELGLCNIMKQPVSFALFFSMTAVKRTVGSFLIIFFLIFLNALRQVRFSNAISLMKSEAVGEKPPKANWVLGLAGVALLAFAYYIAVSIKDPISAILFFFVAVLMVIVGTYLCMIAGSVVLCRLLQKNKKYYYKADHFVSTSSMVYRMKRNGAGLASIYILATMVLVMISSTASLYFGNEDALRTQFPREITFSGKIVELEDMEEDKINDLENTICELAKQYGMEPQNILTYRQAVVTGALSDGTVEVDPTKVESKWNKGLDSLVQFFVIPLSDYNRMMHGNETLEDDEVLFFSDEVNYKLPTISFNRGKTFRIKPTQSKFVGGSGAMEVTEIAYLVVKDLPDAMSELYGMVNGYGGSVMDMEWIYYFDTGMEGEALQEAFEALRTDFRQNVNCNFRLLIESRENNRTDFFASFGGLFYLGIILSIVFIVAAVLIIYYKQVSEGYEDQARFDIMKKVGMTGKEIRKSINSQLLTVFYLPLLFAGMHICFAFPMIRKLLLLFGLANVWLFAGVTLLCFAVFAVFYAVTYRFTSNAYYKIVNRK